MGESLTFNLKKVFIHFFSKSNVKRIKQAL